MVVILCKWHRAVMDRSSLTPNLTVKHRVARALKRAPWLADVIRTVYRWRQTRFTAGVVGVVLNDGGQILLVEHVFHPSEPWGLPGGWLEGDESPVDCLRRELREEAGIEVTGERPLAIEQSRRHRHHLDIAFLCHAENDVQALSTELVDYRWVSLDALPPMTPFNQAAIAALERQRDDKGRQT
jgi:ADP-ribose pyrophosphatase YjhB (NUDIX family)